MLSIVLPCCRYLKRKQECEQQLGDACEMGGFTRLLHSGEADDLMDEVPTFVAQPLPNSVVEHEAYPVLNRPYAFLQWIQHTNITEEFILMSEPDHIFLRPIPNLMRKDAWPAAYPFFYIEPAKVSLALFMMSVGTQLAAQVLVQLPWGSLLAGTPPTQSQIDTDHGSNQT